MPHPPRTGFTLLEVIVALALLALLTALAAPTFVTRRTHDEGSLGRVLQQSRELAIRRAESLTLYIDATGRWWLADDGSATPEPIVRDSLTHAINSGVTIRVSPLGACILESGSIGSTTTPMSLDGVRCALSPVTPETAARTLDPAER